MSSYNDFLETIEIDEKDLKNQQKRNINDKSKNQNYKSKASKQNNIKKTQEKSNKTQNTYAKKNKSENTSTNKVVEDRDRQLQNKIVKNSQITKSNIKNQRKNSKTQDLKKQNLKNNDTKRKKNSNKSNLKPKEQNNVGENYNNKKNVIDDPTSRVSKNRISVEQKTALARKNLNNERIHLKKKKIADKEVLENVQRFTINQDEYAEKILGTVQEKRTKMIYLKDSKKHSKTPIGVAFLGLYAFFLCVIMMYAFSRVGSLKVELKSLNSELSDLNEENSQLDIQLATAYNIDNIRERAENELYMSKPEDYQTIYISVVPENYVEYEVGAEDGE